MGQSWFIRRRLVKGEYYWFAVERIHAGGTRREKTHSLGVTGRHSKRAAQTAFDELLQKLACKESSPGGAAPDGAEEGNGPAALCKDYFTRYLAQIKPSVRPRTYVTYAGWIVRAGEYWANLPLTELKSSHIEAWKAQLAAQYAPSTVNVALRSLNAALSTAVVKGILGRHPMKGVKLAQVVRPTFDPYISMAQFRDVVLTNTASERHRVAFSLAMYAGLRRAEVVHLRWRDVDARNKVIRIESTEEWATKSGLGRLIPLYPDLAAVLKTWKATQGRSHTASDCYVISGTVVPADDSAVTRAWKAYVPAYQAADPAFPPISLHGLRHSFATHLAMSGLNLHTLKSILGHADIQTTMIYAHVEPSRALDLARAITLG